MAALLILSLNLAVDAALAESALGPSKACLQGPQFWCRDVATAAECKREEYCWIHKWNSLLEGLMEEEAEAHAPLFKCNICKKIVQKIRDLAGEDPDEEKIDNAISTTCKVLGRFLRGLCKNFLRMYKATLVEDLQKGMKTQEICVDLKICKQDLQALPAFAKSNVGPPEPCWQGPAFWCKDVTTAIACRKEEYCSTSEWSSSLEGLMEKEAEAHAQLFKCSICKKIVQKIRDLAGDDPDEEKVDNAIHMICKVLGMFLRGPCKNFLRLYKAKLVKDLQNGMETQICVNLRICQPGLQALPGLPY